VTHYINFGLALLIAVGVGGLGVGLIILLSRSRKDVGIAGGLFAGMGLGVLLKAWKDKHPT